ncbi:MAG: amidohydrolase family protein [Acidobacteria bacterium]|nr:amidohydrolase family protein [Acidobacteriota bacterium]
MKRIGLLSLALSSCIWVLILAPPARGQRGTDEARKLERLNAYPDVIVVNGKIHTMDARLSQVQGMAIRNHRIIALGTDDEIRQLAGPRTEVLDAIGRTITPGLIDSHTHPHVWAVEHWLGAEGDFSAQKYRDPQMQIFYAKGNDPVEILRSVERIVLERSKSLGPGKWIWVALFGGSNISESRKLVWPLFQPAVEGAIGTISREFLDTLAPNNPLLVFASEAIGPEAHNTKAQEEMMKILGFEAGGLNARSAVPYDIFFRGRLEDAADFVKRELLTCLVPQGITTFSNHYYGTPSIMKVFRQLYERGELPVRWGWWEGTLWGNQLRGRADSIGDNGDMRFFYRNLGDFRGIGNDYIWNVGVSNEAWETGLSCTAAKPLKTAADVSGGFMMDIVGGLRPDCSVPVDYDQLGGYRNVQAALESGLRIGFLHAYSEGTYEALLHMLDQEIASGRMTLDQVRALRISTEHNPIMRPDEVKRLARYNIMPGFNGYQVQGDIKGGGFLKAYGEQYMNWIAPMKSLVDAGAHPVFNTDSHLHKVPIWSKDMDYPAEWDGNIWAYIEFFVTRRMPSDSVTYNAEERMDRNTMMKSATIWGAEQLLNEKNIGSLEVGKLADFIVLDKDFFTIPEDQIHTIKTLLTVVGGKTVYKDPNY